jgi:branched-chain amino acid transport system ATP-binding protein
VEERNILVIKDVTMTFGGLIALQGINLNISRGQIIGLIGPNGAGKTTLINCISGVFRPTNGDILFGGQSVTKLHPHQVCRAGIGRTFQIPRPFLNMTVFQNLEVCTHRGHVDLLNLLDLTGLRNKRDHLAKNLTFQERRYLELARALAIKPELLLLDEIVAGLNPYEILEMMALIQRIHEELLITILWVEHVMKAIMENAHRIAVLHQGVKIAEGSPHEIADDPQVIEAYLGEKYQFAEAQTQC